MNEETGSYRKKKRIHGELDMNSTFDAYFFNFPGDNTARPTRASIFDAIDAAI
jgi:hypothetical protein